MAGFPIHKWYDFLVVEGDGHEELKFCEKENRIMLAKIKRKLGKGKAETLHQYFMHIQTQYPKIFYLMHLDDEGSSNECILGQW